MICALSEVAAMNELEEDAPQAPVETRWWQSKAMLQARGNMPSAEPTSAALPKRAPALRVLADVHPNRLWAQLRYAPLVQHGVDNGGGGVHWTAGGEELAAWGTSHRGLLLNLAHALNYIRRQRDLGSLAHDAAGWLPARPGTSAAEGNGGGGGGGGGRGAGEGSGDEGGTGSGRGPSLWERVTGWFTG